MDPVVAEKWFSCIENILNMMRVQGNERVLCASYMLRSDASLWWEVVQQAHNVNTIYWAGLKQVFNERYYNSTVLPAKTDDFMRLVQGNLSVIDYAQKFDRLAKFAPNLVTTDRVWADRFVRGLKPMIAQDVEIVSRGAFTYAQVIEMALTAERSEERIWKENDARRDAKKGGAATSNDHKKRGHEKFGQLGQDKRPKPSNENHSNGGRNIPECPKCTKHHFGECRAKACYKCVKEGHIKRNFPLWNQAGNKEEPKKDDKHVLAKVFAITQAVADASLLVVTCQIPMANTTCKVLFDSGIDGRELYVDLNVLDLSNFDVILGMDFLSKYGASIVANVEKWSLHRKAEIRLSSKA
ncbi:uncharacterized protein LOC133814542 [Humulus lupulus]|uniref:uncharacterized protein LOC133814542 n=1 Tax=Humulus lupulus TaxID=3486 RepID=UPI002B4111A3|nr:uncharacterized protein LOC133814542 [Humulus lupulus]